MTYRARCAGRKHPARWRRPILRGPASDQCDFISLTRIMKVHYPGFGKPAHPAWAVEAYKRRWITFEQYLDAKPWPEDEERAKRQHLALMYKPYGFRPALL